jgi:hypothetical protein
VMVSIRTGIVLSLHRRQGSRSSASKNVFSPDPYSFNLFKPFKLFKSFAVIQHPRTVSSPKLPPSAPSPVFDGRGGQGGEGVPEKFITLTIFTTFDACVTNRWKRRGRR